MPADLARTVSGPDTDGENHDVCRIGLAGARLHLDRATFELLEPDHAVIGGDLDAMSFDMALHQAGDLRVQGRQDMVRLLDQSHLEAAMHQIFRRLQPDESTADHHRAGHRLDL